MQPVYDHSGFPLKSEAKYEQVLGGNEFLEETISPHGDWSSPLVPRCVPDPTRKDSGPPQTAECMRRFDEHVPDSCPPGCTFSVVRSPALMPPLLSSAKELLESNIRKGLTLEEVQHRDEMNKAAAKIQRRFKVRKKTSGLTHRGGGGPPRAARCSLR